MALRQEAAARKNALGGKLNAQAKADMDQLVNKIESMTAKLCRKVQDLSDVNATMQLLNVLRDEESEIELCKLRPIVETYELLAHYEVRVSKEV